MKYSLAIGIMVLFFLSLVGCGSSGAQKVEIEQTISSKVKKSFPKFSIVSTNKDQRNGNNVYVVEIKAENDIRSLVYSESGILVEMRQRIQPEKLPITLTKSVQLQYPESVVFMAQKISRGKKIIYQLAIKTGTRRIELNLNEQGKLLEQ